MPQPLIREWLTLGFYLTGRGRKEAYKKSLIFPENGIAGK